MTDSNNSVVITNISLYEFAHALFQPFLSQDEVTEIAINRPGEVWFEERGIWQKQINLEITNKLLKSFAVALASYNETTVDDLNPVLSGTLETGERVQVVLPPAVEKNTISVTLRKPSKNVISHSSYIEKDFYDKVVIKDKNSLSESQKLIDLYKEKEMPLFMERAVDRGKTVVFAGATGSGKTSYMKTLLEYIPLSSRLISIEDTAEIKFYKHQNYVHLFFPSESANDSKAIVTPASLLKASFRMKPDRILLSEIRGGEAWDFIKVINSGHSGSMTSIHAGSVMEAIEGIITRCYQNSECQNLGYSVIRRIILSSIDIVCHIESKMGKRYLSDIYFKDVDLLKIEKQL